jgi:transposase
MITKKRNPHGESHGCSKLKNEQVLEIRKSLGEGMSLSKLAKEFGVSKRAVLNIKHKKTWRHIN